VSYSTSSTVPSLALTSPPKLPFFTSSTRNPTGYFGSESCFGSQPRAVPLCGNIHHKVEDPQVKEKKRWKVGNTRKGVYHMVKEGSIFTCITYPNHHFECIEWLGFAIASAPLPFSFQSSPSSLTVFTLTSPLLSQFWLLSLTPLYIFLIHLIFFVLPWAYRVKTSQRPTALYKPNLSPILYFLMSLFFVFLLCCKTYTDVSGY